MAKNNQKFSFSIDFQLEILRYIIKDKEGPLVINKFKPSYFTLIEHSIISEVVFKFFKKNKRIPSDTILKELLKETLESSKYVDLVTKEDISSIYQIIDNLYNKPLLDQDIIQDKIYKFYKWVRIKNLNESFDPDDFSQFETYNKEFNKIIKETSSLKKEEGPLFMVSGVVDRQFQRQANPNVQPSPFRQINELTNGGGFPVPSTIVLLDKAKAKKTFTMVNWARGYLRMRKNVLYIDTENGQEQIMNRMIQSTLNKTKMEMLSGSFDDLEKRHMRKYSRLGVEFIVRKLPAGIADTNNIKELIEEIKQKHGITIKVLMIDYAGKLASTTKNNDDFQRIHDVYVDIDNLAYEMNLDVVVTSHHVTREGGKHKETRYDESDISGAINIVRNAQAIYGLNSTQEEEEHNIQRMEVVVQRDGKPSGRALFNLDVERQRMNEFTKAQRQEYDSTVGADLDKQFSKKTKNPVAKDIDSTKKGDI